MSKDIYRHNVINPGDRTSQLAHDVNIRSFQNNPAVRIVPHRPNDFRGPVGYIWSDVVLKEMLRTRRDPDTDEVLDWVMLEGIENDGSGGKPQFFTLLGDFERFVELPWEFITMCVDDFARSGRYPVIMVNDLNCKSITPENFHLVEALFQGYGEALKKARLVGLTGETAIMQHSVTAFCDINTPEQLVMTWSGTCLGLTHRDLLLDPTKIEPGMPIVGFWEPGYRCNGGTFFTNLLMMLSGNKIEALLQSNSLMSFARRLTVPSQSYARAMCWMIGWNDDGSIRSGESTIIAAAHITGGGMGKLQELLPKGVSAHLDTMPEPAEVLLEAQELSWGTPLQLLDDQAYTTFHGGCGMLLVCENQAGADRAKDIAKRFGIRAFDVGRTVSCARKDSEVIINSRFKEEKLVVIGPAS